MFDNLTCNYSISLLQKYNVTDTKQLRAYEQLWMNKLNHNNILPSFNPIMGRCKHERKKYSCKECKGPARCEEHNKIKKTCNRGIKNPKKITYRR